MNDLNIFVAFVGCRGKGEILEFMYYEMESNKYSVNIDKQ